MTIDLFSTPLSPASPPDVSALHLASGKLLDRILSDSGKKTALKAMDGQVRAQLVVAVVAIAQAKRDAYTRALTGEYISLFGWAVENPAFAAAMALLNRHFVDSNAIPMAAVPQEAA